MNNTWYHIPGFNGYQINKDGEVRSMKMMYANPGYYLKRRKDGSYELTNDENKRIRIKPEKLLKLTFESGKNLYPVIEDDVYLGGRNKIFKNSKKKKDISYGSLSLNIQKETQDDEEEYKLQLKSDNVDLKHLIRFYD